MPHHNSFPPDPMYRTHASPRDVKSHPADHTSKILPNPREGMKVCRPVGSDMSGSQWYPTPPQFSQGGYWYPIPGTQSPYMQPYGLFWPAWYQQPKPKDPRGWEAHTYTESDRGKFVLVHIKAYTRKERDDEAKLDGKEASDGKDVEVVVEASVGVIKNPEQTDTSTDDDELKSNEHVENFITYLRDKKRPDIEVELKPREDHVEEALKKQLLMKYTHSQYKFYKCTYNVFARYSEYQAEENRKAEPTPKKQLLIEDAPKP